MRVEQSGSGPAHVAYGEGFARAASTQTRGSTATKEALADSATAVAGWRGSACESDAQSAGGGAVAGTSERARSSGGVSESAVIDATGGDATGAASSAEGGEYGVEGSQLGCMLPLFDMVRRGHTARTLAPVRRNVSSPLGHQRTIRHRPAHRK